MLGLRSEELLEHGMEARMMSAGSAIGSTAVLSMLSLMTAIYWGELSHCQSGYNDVTGYSCYSPSAMRSVSAFASLLFITEVFFAAAIVIWKDELFNESLDSYDVLRGNGRGLPDGAFNVADNSAAGAGSQPMNNAVDL
eukprot:CAMPEP_0171452364 /NCGR_PEP_ID=MMETSP0945-20130129/502_1 /TAXON_ID=109269 /ORGANISM="Vaucheria litorea, Strain CCMP2940" /LENGTH=138 /DNA_ID=CAMNT_0011977017 /DNA_START=271 /DNA_END=687 /DNA_ORIENTATION=+